MQFVALLGMPKSCENLNFQDTVFMEVCRIPNLSNMKQKLIRLSVPYLHIFFLIFSCPLPAVPSLRHCVTIPHF